MNNLAPRLGVTWDPGSDGRTVVRAGYGIYYDQINTTTMRGVVAGYPGLHHHADRQRRAVRAA